MGQAKLRGTFEQRKAQAEAKAKELAIKNAELHRTLYQRRGKSQLLPLMLAMAVAANPTIQTT